VAAEEGDKTEEPTPHKLSEARKKGQVAYSREINVALVMITAFMAFKYLAAGFWDRLISMTVYFFDQIPRAKELDYSMLGNLFLVGLFAFAFGIAPILGLSLLVGVLTGAIQTGFNASGFPLLPQLSRINPVEGFKRMFSLQGLVELTKSLLKIIIVFWIGIRVILDNLPLILNAVDLVPTETMALVGELVLTIAIRVSLFYIIIAIFDYLYRRWDYMRNMRMTRQEVKEEYKRLEGDPLVKQRIRQIQQQMAYQRMMGAVPGADVVVTNPTHLAVAMRYKAEIMSAPQVVAKGRYLVAEEIVRVATENNVPVVENELLAQALFRTTRVGEEISYELYRAVAEVLAFVYKIKKQKSRFRPPVKSFSPAR
jgi:flagellar biosynthetic protein FlhB